MTRLGDVVALRKERSRLVNGGSQRVLQLEDIEVGTGRMVEPQTSDAKVAASGSDGLAFYPGDVLFGRLRPYLCKYYRPDQTGVCSGEFWVLKPDSSRILSGYLYNLVQTEAFMAAAQRTSGSRMPRSDWGVVQEHRIVLPSLSEQTRIVRVLEAWDDAIVRIKRQEAALRRQRRGILSRLITGTGRAGNRAAHHIRPP